MTNNSNPVVVHGASAGIPVAIKPELAPVYRNMERLAKQGNHWARLCVYHLQSLSSNQFKNNVFVHDNGRLEQFGEYTMILPGCRASFRKNQKGQFYIYALEADANFLELQKQGKAPSLFRVAKSDKKSWDLEFIPNGDIKHEKGRIVAISDQQRLISEATNSCARAIGGAPIGGGSYVSKLNGFDMHFTPGKHKIGGLRNIGQARNAATSRDLHESALLLANTMERSRKVNGVSWISDNGGSGVLTQAMRILKDKKISFKDTGHHAFFSNLTTDLVTIEQLARDLEISFSRTTHKRNFLHPDQLIGAGVLSGYRASWNRFRKDKNHSVLKLGTDTVKETSGFSSAAGTLGLSSAAVAAAFGVSASSIALPAGIAFAVAIGPKIFKAGSALAEAWMPNQYDKIKGKF